MKKLFLIIPLTSVLLFSCGKKKFNNATDTAQDNDLSESLTDEVFNAISNEITAKEDAKFGKSKSALSTMTPTAACATVTYTLSPDSSYIDSITIDYGSGCVYNGRTFKGTIYVTLNGRFRDQGTTATITLGNDFYIDNYKVEGTKAITNQGFSGTWLNGQWTFSVQVSNGKITTSDGEVITWESSRTHVITWKLGDGLYLYVTGSANGVNRNGNNYTITVIDDLVWKAGCGKHPIDGTLKITVDNVNKDITIDYGDGTCDNSATLTVGNKKAKNITL